LAIGNALTPPPFFSWERWRLAGEFPFSSPDWPAGRRRSRDPQPFRLDIDGTEPAKHAFGFMLHSELIPAAEKDSRRLMVMLHGLGDSLDGWRWFPEVMNLPWLNYLLVNAPDDYYGGYSWFDLDNMAPGVQRSRKLLFDLLDDLRAKDYAAEQITFGGFSQGCLMAIETGLHYPHRLAGIVGISGWIYEAEKLLRELSPIARQQRLLMTHGTSDPMIPIDKVRPQIPLLKAGGLSIEWHEFRKAHTVAGEEEIAVIRNFVRAGYPSE
jgi:phospholipase/carboxylesterase